MATYAYTFTSGDTVTPTKLNNARTVSEIVNADISATAAIAGTKVAPAFGAQDITVSTANRSITNTGNFALSFGTNNTTRVTIPAAGGISIVTGSPDRIGASFSNNAVSTLDFGSPDSGDGNFQLQYDRAGGHFKFLGGSTGSQTERMRIDVFGNVGIGTSSPIANVHVRSASGTTLRLDQTSGEATIESTNTGVGLRDLVLKGDKLIFNANAAERMRIDASGNVGIGATAPVNYANNTTLTLLGTNGSGMTFGTNGGSDRSEIYYSATETYLKTINNTSLWFGTNNAERMRIKFDGNVGIGTASPAYTLHVNGSVAGTSAYNNLSDAREKENIVYGLVNALDTVKALKPAKFDFKEGDKGKIGFIAQDVQPLVPEVITSYEKTLPDDTKEERLSIQESSLTAVLVAAVQELSAKVEALEAA
jgi:hypothetical protein